MNERLKKLRKALNYTQQEFADKIGMKRNTIANYETDRNEPSNSVVSLICREFDVNEEWIRNGFGEMFIDISRDDQIASFAGHLLREEDKSFKKRLITALASLSEEEWNLLENISDKMNNCKEPS